jgi:LacI family transcriptional regulator
MHTHRLTIYDLAKRLGISHTTVSRALRNQQGISKATIKKVQDLAAEMGYNPNSMAAGLRTKKSFNIGVLVPQIDRAFIASFISGIEEVANEAGYSVLIYQSLDDPEKEVRNAHSLISSNVDGAIISLAMKTVDLGHIQEFLDRQIPLVMADRIADELQVDKVVVDNFKAAFLVTEYLINCGYKYIAHIAGFPTRNVYRDRKEGYLSALKKYHLPFDSHHLIFSDLSEKAGVEAVDQLVKLSPMPDAIFGANDTVSVSALLHLQELGIRVPEEVAVFGFNNDPISSIVHPRLSTVDHPARQIGQTAAYRLLQRINAADAVTPTLPIETITLKTSLIIRESATQLAAVTS